MRIAMIQSFLPSRSQGGVGHGAHQLAEGLTSRGHEVTLFSLDPPVSGASYQTRVLAEDGGQRPRWREAFRFGFDVARQDFRQFDLIHAHGDNQWLRASPPVLRTFHGSCFDEALRARRLRSRALFSLLYMTEVIAALRADLCVGISENSRKRLPFRKMVIVPHGTDLSVFRPGSLKSPTPSVLFVGHRLRDRKRADLLMEVFERTVLRKVPDAVLHMVCEEGAPARGWLRQYRDVSLPELVELYQKAWVFCLPSVYEGFGRPYVEAMACGTAVVATRNPGSREVLGEEGSCGVIAEEHGLGEQIARLLADEEERRRLERSGLQRVRERYSLASVVSAYERLYEFLVAGRRRVPADASISVKVERT